MIIHPLVLILNLYKQLNFSFHFVFIPNSKNSFKTID